MRPTSADWPWPAGLPSPSAGAAGEAEDWAGDAACPVGEAVAAGVEPASAEPPWFALHPATAAPSAAQSRSWLTLWLTTLETPDGRDGCDDLAPAARLAGGLAAGAARGQ